MSHASKSLISSHDLPDEMSTLNIQDDHHTTPTPKDKKALSDSSSTTMTTLSSVHGAPLSVDDESPTEADRSAPMFFESNQGDDVFGEATAETPTAVTGMPSTSIIAAAKIQANLATPVAFKQTPRPDRMNSPITPANAQGVLPPEACVFVANLATARTDDQLEISCHDHFDVFGECHIKVRRDKHRHPFALVQYYSVEDANSAIRASRDIVIDGRSIRTEHAQARRSLVLTRVGGGIITKEEAAEVLGGFGPLAQLHPTTNSDARDLGMPEGMWIQFTYYLDYKDALKSFNSTTSQYRIYVPPEVEARTRTGPSGSPVIQGFRTPRSSTDQKSIFVGNLPVDTTEHHLKQLFGHCGLIRAVNIIHKPIHGGCGYNIFGFIEFSAASEAAAAANMEIEVLGSKIRVEPKEYSARRHTRLQSYSPTASPFWRGPRQAYNPQANPMGYNAGYYGLQSPSHTNTGYNQAQNVAEMSPYQYHGGYNNVFATPPQSARGGRRNEVLYTGSPHGMAQWNPYVVGSGYNGQMMQIPEELDGQRY